MTRTTREAGSRLSNFFFTLDVMTGWEPAQKKRKHVPPQREFVWWRSAPSEEAKPKPAPNNPIDLKAALDRELAEKQERKRAERQRERDEDAARAAAEAMEARAAAEREKATKYEEALRQKAALDAKVRQDKERFREDWEFRKGKTKPREPPQKKR